MRQAIRNRCIPGILINFNRIKMHLIPYRTPTIISILTAATNSPTAIPMVVRWVAVATNCLTVTRMAVRWVVVATNCPIVTRMEAKWVSATIKYPTAMSIPDRWASATIKCPTATSIPGKWERVIINCRSAIPIGNRWVWIIIINGPIPITTTDQIRTLPIPGIRIEITTIIITPIRIRIHSTITVALTWQDHWRSYVYHWLLISSYHDDLNRDDCVQKLLTNSFQSCILLSPSLLFCTRFSVGSIYFNNIFLTHLAFLDSSICVQYAGERKQPEPFSQIDMSRTLQQSSVINGMRSYFRRIRGR